MSCSSLGISYLLAACLNDSSEQLTEALGKVLFIYAYTVASM